jgi:outer membrane protein assembly factor BamB
MMKRLIITMTFLSLAVITGFTLYGSGGYSLAATDMSADDCYSGPNPTIESKVIEPSQKLTFNGVAYIAGHGGHIAIIDMRTMKPPTDIEKDRIVLTEAGSEMEGKIAGMSFESVKKSGGTHGQAIVTEKGNKVLIAGTLAGNVYKIDLATGKKQGPFKVGEKFCGAIVGPDGKLYFEDGRWKRLHMGC